MSYIVKANTTFPRLSRVVRFPAVFAGCTFSLHWQYYNRVSGIIDSLGTVVVSNPQCLLYNAA